MFNMYIIEIRNRILLILTCLSFLFFVSYINKEVILFLIIKPNINVDENFYFIATDAREILNAYLTLSTFVSFNISFYITVLHLIYFFSPALYSFELLKLNTISCLSAVSGVLSTFIFNKITLPVCWFFFLSFQSTSNSCVNIFLELKIEKYLEFYFSLYYINLFLFQFILFFFLLIDNLDNIINFFKKTRKLTYFILILIATFATPPDVLSQLIVFSILSISYEVGIIIVILKRFYLIR